MFDIICLWIGRLLIGPLALIVFSFALFLLYKLAKVIFLPPWFFVKHLVPGFHITEQDYKEYVEICQYIKENPSKVPKERRGVKLYRKRNFMVLYFPTPKLYNPKRHLFYIKKEK